MSGEIRTQGTEIYYVSGPTAVTKIPNVISFGDYGKQASPIATTNLDSTAAEFISGLPDNGEVTLTMNFIANDLSHQYLQAQAGTATRVEFCIGYSDGTVAPTAAASAIVQPLASARTSEKFLAAITSARKSVNTANVLSMVVTLKISGAITQIFKT